MSKQKSDLNVLLLQIRDEPRVRREEYDSFANFSGLSKSQIDILNVFDTPKFSPHVVDPYDALIIGGASEASVLEPDNYPFVKCGEDICLYCIDKSFPVFASCFGFQLVVVALGGNIIKDVKNFEMGVIPIQLTEAAKEDPLFCDLNQSFLAVSVHQEKSLKAPAGCTTLARTDQCCHSFRVNGRPFWTFQFHPEVDKKTIIERLTIYKDKYTESDEHLDRVLSSVVETPESNRLIESFVERVLLNSSG